MKCVIPEISWHNRDPVLSVDIQPLLNNTYRLASGGGDCHVLIWLLKVLENGAIEIDAVSDLTRHQRAVNVVRWSHSGQYLASGDDDANIIIWQLKTDNVPLLDGNNTNDKEVWIVLKVLRGHKEDIYDICWSPDDCKLLSGSIDNTAIIWDFSKGKIDKILTDHKGFVQGVSWDPKNEFISTASSDRICRIFDHTGKHLKYRTGKGLLPVAEDHPLFGKQVKYFHDDTFKSYFRRLKFSPDGNLLVVPAGCVETDDCKKALNATFIFTLDNLQHPVAVLPTGKQCSVCVSFCPQLFELRPDGPDPIIPLPYRMIFAVATDTDVIIYDTQQTKPIAYLQKIHYTRLTDISWSIDGLLLVAASTDGFCTVVNFKIGELGSTYVKEEEEVEETEEEIKEDNKEKETAIESKPKENETKKRPTILDQWTIKTPKRKLEGLAKNEETLTDSSSFLKATPKRIKPIKLDDQTDSSSKLTPKRITPIKIDDKTQTDSSSSSKSTPKRIKPIKIDDQTKSPTVKKKTTEITSTPKKKGSLLNFIITKPVTPIVEEEARDAWKCQNDNVVSKETIDLTEDSMQDFKLELSVSQSINDSEVKNDENTPEIESRKSPTSAENKENNTKNPVQEAKKPRRVQLITLSSPRSSSTKKGS